MESWENEILANKLNSLTELPDGYTPNLSSKWEIIEAGLTTSKKRRIPLLVSGAVAAAVLGIVVLIWTETRYKNELKYAAEPIETPAFTKRLPVQKSTQPINEKQATATVNRLPQKSFPVPVHAFALQKDTQSLTELTATKTVPPKTLLTDSFIEIKNNVFIPEKDIAIAPLPPVIKSVKHKTYQRDFNDGVLAMDTGFSQSPRQHFSIQLNPFSRKADDGGQAAHGLQLKQSL